jgi:HlyD family secretion protein
MDTILKPPSFKEKLFKNWQSVLKYVLITVVCFWLLSSFAGHSVDKDQVRIATVKRGDLVTQIEGSGNVKVSGLNSFYSPVESYVKDVFKREGHSVIKGDTILTIDSSELDKSILEIRNRIRISQNNLKTKDIEFEVLQVNNKKNKEIYETNREKHLHELNVSTKLNKMGAISEGDVLVKKAELKKDEIDLKYLAQIQSLQQQKLQQEIETLKLNIQISENEYAFQKNLKLQTVLVANETGAVSKQVYLGGEKLQKGQLIAQVSNLSSFVVKAQISQRQLDRVQVGQPVIVKINDRDYTGVLALLQPEIKNGYGVGEINFDKNQNLQLKQNQRAQVFIQTGFKENTLLIERGAFISAGGRYAFKVEDDTAIKTAISLGGRNYKVVEVLSGLEEGDKIVVSQITSFIDWDKFKIN